MLALAATGLRFAVIAPANIVVSPRLPGRLRASALSLLMGALVATQAAGADTAGLAATAVGILPVCLALGVPPVLVGAYALLAPTHAGTSTGDGRTGQNDRGVGQDRQGQRGA